MTRDIQITMIEVILDSVSETEKGFGPAWSGVVTSVRSKINDSLEGFYSRSWCEAGLLEVRRMLRGIGLVKEDGRDRVTAIFRTPLGEQVRKLQNRREYLSYLLDNYNKYRETLTIARILCDLRPYEMRNFCEKLAQTELEIPSCECKNESEKVLEWHPDSELILSAS